MDKVLSYLGLARKAGKLAVGEFLTENAIYSKKAVLVIVAEDASGNTKKKFTDRCNHHKVELRFYKTKAELGNATGSALKASMAVLDEGFAKAILNILNQLLNGKGDKMSKMKVSELSTEINKKSKEIVDFLKANGYDNVKNMNSVLSDEEEKAARMEFAPETIKKEKPKAKAEPKPKKVKAAPVEKQIEQTFDGRSPEVREAAERKAKKASAESEAKKAASKDEAAPKTKKAKEAPAKEADSANSASDEPVVKEQGAKSKETKAYL